EWDKAGVVFMDMDSGLREHEDLVREYFGTIIPADDNKFSALNSAVWSGGSFVYVPPGVHIDIPLQAYFRINAENMGQFERTLIIADEGSYVHYIEGCTAPTYTTNSLHSAVVELIAKPNARIRYSTIQNWSHNTYNLVTKRAVAEENATVEWVDGNLGSKLTMKYPAVYLTGEGARGEILSVAYAGDGQHQDAGGKVVHAAPNTSSLITSKSISKGTGRSTYRGLLKVHEGAVGSKSRVECDALLLDENARTDTYPYIEIEEKKVNTEHEATVSKVGEDQLFYLMSRGLSEEAAMAMVVNGFIEPIAKELPLEYAIELNRLIQLEMEGSVG
ncbi:MAG TPA: Fe-S cluster assembly protein SufB, partial [Rubrobacter sp.]|nr:Fe-S cluster assembly protein SufB [Rubrobacter sp.]